MPVKLSTINAGKASTLKNISSVGEEELVRVNAAFLRQCEFITEQNSGKQREDTAPIHPQYNCNL